MQKNGSSPGTAHQAHRTIRTALNEAVRRQVIVRNPAVLAKPPRLADEEIEPYSVEDVQRLLIEAGRCRNTVAHGGPSRWPSAFDKGKLLA
jgi:integrase